jgi:hypothetical protein
MKKTKLLLIGIAVFGLAMISKAQIIGNYTAVTGTNYYNVLYSFQVQSNLNSIAFTPHTLQITNVITNTTYNASYGLVFSGQAATNMIVLGTLTTNLVASNGWVNGSTFTWQFPSQGYQFSVSPTASLGISNPGFSSGSVTNYAQFQ